MTNPLSLVTTTNIRSALEIIRDKGVLTLLRYAYHDFLFDRRYGTDTINVVSLSDLTLPCTESEEMLLYQPISCYRFRQVMNILPIEQLRNGVFVDFGSGKGRAMLLADAYCFRCIIGVEFARELVEICRKNLEKYRLYSNTKTDFAIIHMDATQYSIPPSATLLFFNSPFTGGILNQVLENINRSLEVDPRLIHIIYTNPRQPEVFDQLPNARRIYDEHNAVVYQVGS
jgi:predicted RNA methylase